MSDLQPGDRVVYTGKYHINNPESIGRVGTVKSRSEHYPTAEVTWDDGSTLVSHPYLGNLERIDSMSTIASRELEELKKQIADKALSMAGQNWCREGIIEALAEVGIDATPKWPADPVAGTYVYCSTTTGMGYLSGFIRGSAYWEPTYRIHDREKKSEFYWSDVVEFFEKNGHRPENLKVVNVKVI